jgi:hypothetical protein
MIVAAGKGDDAVDACDPNGDAARSAGAVAELPILIGAPTRDTAVREDHTGVRGTARNLRRPRTDDSSWSSARARGVDGRDRE